MMENFTITDGPRTLEEGDEAEFRIRSDRRSGRVRVTLTEVWKKGRGNRQEFEGTAILEDKERSIFGWYEVTPFNKRGILNLRPPGVRRVRRRR